MFVCWCICWASHLCPGIYVVPHHGVLELMLGFKPHCLHAGAYAGPHFNVLVPMLGLIVYFWGRCCALCLCAGTIVCMLELMLGVILVFWGLCCVLEPRLWASFLSAGADVLPHVCVLGPLFVCWSSCWASF